MSKDTYYIYPLSTTDVYNMGRGSIKKWCWGNDGTDAKTGNCFTEYL